MKIEFNFESPYAPDGSPRQDLPTGEVLAWDGKGWGIGFLFENTAGSVSLEDDQDCGVYLLTVVRFAPLPTIIEEDGNEVL